MQSTASNITRKPLTLLRPDVGTIHIRRTLAREGVDAQITMLSEKLQQASIAEGEQTHTQKRKRSLEEEKEMNELAERIKKLRCDEVLPKGTWELLDKVVWEKSGLLYRPWRFDG